MMFRIATLLATLTLHAIASPIPSFATIAKQGCTAVDPAKCDPKSKTGNCLECASDGGWDCLKCCPGCKQAKYGSINYCSCAPPPPPPVPGVAQVNGNMTWAGKERQWMSLVPDQQPTGLIVVVEPVDASYLGNSCPNYAAVSHTTGALVVCPAALQHPGTKGGTPGTCWKAWGNYGTCGLQNDSEDVDFLAAMMTRLLEQYNIPAEKVIMSGMSNGGSMAYRFNCERSEMIGGLAIQSQAYFDPYVGFYNYETGVVPSGTPQCKPTKKVPFYSDIGTTDVYYGLNVSTPGFQGLQKWRDNYSTAVLGCTGEVTETSRGPHQYPDGQGRATCYQFASCPEITGVGLNVFCSVPGMGHDDTGFMSLLPAAFQDFFE